MQFLEDRTARFWQINMVHPRIPFFNLEVLESSAVFQSVA